MKLNIIPVKFNKKISVADIKQYLVERKFKRAPLKLLINQNQ